ncbi:hypothetical protein EJ04DRAFT_569950 [Polyplosphaeria fusca]|uniref:Uncharacterized protein n=1 Tax=Polyplosphaeria fusca TaxID=682080 RepID=A0A9P4UWH3_9PLEO|nr:hypothetical protein EJ04DRAFT_569950 [Polyplosphaeria fusca]
MKPQADGRLLRDGGTSSIRETDRIGDSSDPEVHSPDKGAVLIHEQQHVPRFWGQAKPRQRFLRRAGKRALVLGFLSIIFVGGAVGFLAWLWYGSRSGELWRRLALGGWSSQAVAIASLVLRTALVLLAGIATSMIASVALEDGGVPLRNAVDLSVARFASPGPNTFWYETFFQRDFIAVPLRGLLGALILSTLAVQFSSTILLSDIGNGRVVGFLGNSTNSTGFSWAHATFGHTADGRFRWTGDFESHNAPFQSQQEFWSGQLRSSHAFAEYTSPRVTSHEAIDDTGPTLRAFLPIENQGIRYKLRNFSGLAPVFDTRVVCVRPDFVEGYLYQKIYNLTLKLPDFSDTIPGLRTSRENFIVELPRVDPRGSHGWTIYPLSNSVGGLLSQLDASGQRDLNLTYKKYDEGRAPSRFQGHVKPLGVWRSDDQRACGVDLGNAYVVMDTRGPFDSAWFPGGYDYDGKKGLDGPGHGPWRRIDVEHDAQDPLTSLGNVTICFDSLPKGAQYHHIQDFEIKASGTGTRFEPSITFRAAKENLDIIALRSQLGPPKDEGRLTIEERNILRLDSVESIYDVVKRSSKQWDEYCSLASEIERDENDLYWHPNIYNRTTYSWIKEMALSISLPIATCTGNCVVRGNGESIRASRGLSWIIDEITRPTESPALGIRAALTQVLRETYYSWLTTLDYESELRTVTAELVQIPLKHHGFWVVCGLTFLHLALCAIAILLFAMLTETSCLNNGWQATAVLVNHEDSKRILEEARDMGDDEVKRWISTDRSLSRRFIVGRGKSN